MGLSGWHGPLATIFRKYVRLLPLVAVLGVVGGLFEGIGIGLLIPLVALLLADAMPSGLPGPIADLVTGTAALDRETRILAFGGALMGFIIAKGLIQAANNLLIANIEGRIGRDMRNALCARLLTLDYTFFLRNEGARLVQIISIDSWFASDAVRAALGAIPAAITLAVIGTVLIWLDWRLSLIVLAGAAVIGFALPLIERRQRRLSVGVTATSQRLGERMLAVVGAMRAIRVFGQQGRELEKFARASEEVRRGSFGVQRVGVAILPIIEVLISTLFVAVLLVAYGMGTSIPNITAFLVLLSRTQSYAHVIGRARVQVASLSGSLTELDWLLEQRTAPESAAGTTAVPAIDRTIRLERVSYQYPDGSSAVSDVSVAIEPGVATALIGKSGSGKTTLVNLLCRLVEPTSGTLYHGNEALAEIDPRQWREHIAIAGQDTDLLDGTVAENIAYARPGAARAEIEEAARVAGADGFIAMLPAGYETRIGLEGLNLSGGQRQRIGLARALLRRPDLLILDEAISAVDAISEGEIMKLLSEHRHFRTALVVSHRRSTLAACQAGIVIDGGRIVEAGPLRDLAYYGDMV